MTIFEHGLRHLLQEQRKYFLESLEAGGLDIFTENWDSDIIERNAQAGAESVMMFVSHPKWSVENGVEVVVSIQNALDEEPDFSVMAYIYGAYELSHRIPPYGILQHAVNDRLLSAYCSALKKYLSVCVEGKQVLSGI